MRFQLFLAIALWTSSASAGKYLTYKLDHSKNFNGSRSTIEFWPYYEPDSRWLVDNDQCRYDVKIKFIPFQNSRMIDYDARNQGILPTLDLGYFANKDLLPVFQSILNKSRTCSYDAVWFDPPSRFYAYHGFKMSVYDSYHRYSWTSYAPVPFLRNVDAVFRDPATRRVVFVSNHWYYTFDVHGGFVNQGRLSYLWSNFRSSPYLDSVLVTRNHTLCRIYDDQIHCTRFDTRTLRLADAPTDGPRAFSEVFQGGSPAFPLKGSFWYPDKNETAFLDSNDTFWIYDEGDTFSRTTPFCEYESFEKFPCCLHHRRAEDLDDEEPSFAWWSFIMGFFLF